MPEDWMKERVDEHTGQIKAIELKNAVQDTKIEAQSAAIAQYAQETRDAFSKLDGNMLGVSDKLTTMKTSIDKKQGGDTVFKVGLPIVIALFVALVGFFNYIQ